MTRCVQRRSDSERATYKHLLYLTFSIPVHNSHPLFSRQLIVMSFAIIIFTFITALTPCWAASWSLDKAYEGQTFFNE
jgi:hypothetical protein